MLDDFNFDPAVGFVLPGIDGVRKKQGVGTAALGCQSLRGDALVYQPFNHDLGPSLACLSVESPRFASVGAIDMADNVQMDGWIFNEPIAEFFGDTKTLGMKLVLIADEVNPQDVRSLAVLQRPQFDADIGMRKKVWIEGFGVEHETRPASNERVSAVGNDPKDGVRKL